MAQKLILCEGTFGSDVLEHEPLAGIIAAGYEVASVSGFSTIDNRAMCYVLLAEPASTDESDDSEESNGGEGGSSESSGGSSSGSDGEGSGGSSSDLHGGPASSEVLPAGGGDTPLNP